MRSVCPSFAFGTNGARSPCMCMCKYKYMYMYVYLYMYMYVFMCICVYVYIYIHIYKLQEGLGGLCLNSFLTPQEGLKSFSLAGTCRPSQGGFISMILPNTPCIERLNPLTELGINRKGKIQIKHRKTFRAF